jgi:hypothetical protein
VDSTTQFVSIVILVLVLATNLILTQITRRRSKPVVLRDIPAYDTIPLLVGEAIEADRPVHASFGSTALGGNTTVLSAANAELVYWVTQRAATGPIPPILTMSDTTVIPLAQDTLRRAYESRDRLDRYPASSIHWYPAGGHSLAFAAALTSDMANDRVAGSVLAGIYGTELALILDAANRRDQTTIATSTALEGQAVAYALSERPLIGEEVFAAGAYLGGQPNQVAAVTTIDFLRGLLILFILIPTIDALTHGALAAAVTRLLGRH